MIVMKLKNKVFDLVEQKYHEYKDFDCALSSTLKISEAANKKYSDYMSQAAKRLLMQTPMSIEEAAHYLLVILKKFDL